MIDMPILTDPRHKTWKARWPEGLTDYTVEIGKAKVVREGSHVTVVSYGRTLPICAAGRRTGGRRRDLGRSHRSSHSVAL